MTDHIIDHGYSLVDIDGKPTTWGYWSPEKLNDDPVWWQERGLNSLEMLSHLKVAYHIVREPRYRRAYRESDSEASLCDQHPSREGSGRRKPRRSTAFSVVLSAATA